MGRIRKQGLTRHFLGGCAAIALLAGSVSAQAAHIEGELAVELAGDYGKQGSDKTKSVNPTVELAAGLFFTPSWSLQGGWTLESLSEADTSYFRRLGLSTDELYVQYEAGMFRVFGGKVNPTFGTAWDSAPGVYGTGLAEDYELGEGYMAAGAAVSLKAAGEHILTGTVYRTDRSFLSQTAFTASGPTERTGDDAAVANTKGLESFSVTLDSGNIFGVDGLNTHLGYRSQAKGDGIDKDETGFVVGVSYGMNLTPAVKMELMGEYADFSNYGGTDKNDARYMTLGAGFTYQTYNLAVAYTMKEEGTSGNEVDSTLLSASIGAEIWNEWALDVGYSLGTEDGAEDTHTVGFTLAKSFEFTNGQ